MVETPKPNDSSFASTIVEMCLGDLLPLQRLFTGESPCFDKDPSLPAYTLGSLVWPACPAYKSKGSDREVCTIESGVRVHVPMHDEGDDSVRTYRLLNEAARFKPERHLSAWSLEAIERYFEGMGTKLFLVATNPNIRVDLPKEARHSIHPKIPVSFAYCMPLGSEFGLRVKLNPLGKGYLIWNPLAILRVQL